MIEDLAGTAFEVVVRAAEVSAYLCRLHKQDGKNGLHLAVPIGHPNLSQ